MAEYRHKHTVLDNGLTVVTVNMPHLHSAYISIFARVGSRHEKAENNGISHFLEHMFFRGCEGFPDSTALNAAMEDYGGVLDGFTSRDSSSYHTTVHPQHVRDAIEIFGSMFLASTFSDIDVERSIIMEEMLDAIDDRGRMIDLDNIAHREAFAGHSLGLPIEGSQKNVRRFHVDDLMAHRRKYYGAANMVVCVAGKINSSNCRKAIQRTFGPLRKGRRATETAPKLQEPKPRLVYVRTDEPQTRIRLSFRTVSEEHPDYAALDLLRHVLDGGLSGRLQNVFVEKLGLAYDISADIEMYSDCGLFNFEVAVSNRKLLSVLERLVKFISELRKEGLTKEELDRVRYRASLALEFSLDSPQELSHWYGESALFRKPKKFGHKIKSLKSVQTEDILRVCRTYLSPTRLTATAVGGADPNTVKKARSILKKPMEEK